MIVQIAFLTGRSASKNCALSPVQSGFLAKLADEDRVLIPVNFPYHETSIPYKPTPIIIASMRNSFDYYMSRLASFRNRYKDSVETLLNQAPRTVILAGSCGLEILSNLHLSQEILDRIAIVAYGPVARSIPKCDCVIVQGKRDWLSNGYFPRPNYLVDADHMNYLENGEMLDICNKVINRVHCGVTD